MKNLFRAVSMGLLFLSIANAGQQKIWYGSPLTVNVAISEVGPETKFSVTFKNRGNLDVRDLNVQRVGLPIFYRDFCPSYRIPLIRPGKTYTLNVFLRGHIAVASDDEIVLVTGTYRAGRESIVMEKRIRIFCD